VTVEIRDVRAEDAFDVAAVHGWLQRESPELAGQPLPEVRQFAGGASNLTYLLAYGDRELVLRRPPRGRKAASAHDMGREVRVQERIRPVFPVVPRIYGFCQDGSLIGSEFYVMERLHGVILGRPLPEGLLLDRDDARTLGETVFDILADLHSLDVEAAGLADLGRGPGYVRRQVSGWSSRFRDARTDDVPDGRVVMAWLDSRQPADAAARLVHGDWKLDNLVLDLPASPRITGVLDWEMATVGDPLMDLGGMLAYWVEPGDDEFFQMFRRQPTTVPGMWTRQEVVEHYCERIGHEVVGEMTPERWRFYEVFGLFRLAVIAQQIWYRYYHRQTTNEAYAVFGPAVGYLETRCRSLLAVGRTERPG
jgi:aminoglycoside phosphotransferase (APT) family kinase protein